MDLDKLKFDQNGLIPAIVVDEVTKDVLTLAYMNRESLEISLREGTTCFYSRSRQTLWRKGETSGNVQHIVSITADCDCDALDKILKKVGEESTEVIVAGKGGDKAETIYEIADLAYHVMVLMVEMGISVEDIHHELASRRVIDHKIKQEKMV